MGKIKRITLPSQEYLKECLNYNPLTGLLHWKERPREHFKTAHGWNIFNSKFANKIAMNQKRKDGYLSGGLDGKTYFTHRIVYKIFHGTEPEHILHSKGNREDNRIQSLSEGTENENMKDQKKYTTNKSGVVGVCFHKVTSKWQAFINDNGKKFYLGLFLEKDAAIAARKEAEVKWKYHPEHGKR